MNDYPQDTGHAPNGGANGSSMVMMGFVVGAAVGAGVALLLAPASGEETRRRLGQTASRWGASMKEGMDHARTRLGDLKSDVGTAVSSGREAFARERDARTEEAHRG